MSDPKPQEIQQELFREFSKESRRTERIPPLAHAQKPILFSTTLEHLLLGGILFILVLCLVFFLGVLRGKSLTTVFLPSAARPAATVSYLPQKTQTTTTPRITATTPPAAVSLAPARPGANTTASVPSPSSVTAASRNSAAKPYTIQLVTHKKKETAENEAAALKRSGYYSFIMTSGEYYLVCVGQYASKEEAKKDLHNFSGKFSDCFLRRR